MAAYYVDKTIGDDAYDGLSATDDGGGIGPWETLAQITATALSAGDSVSLKRGEVWREAYVVSDAGTSGNRITLTAHGSGALPKITGFDEVDTWSQYEGNTGDLIEDNFDDGDLSGWTEQGTAMEASTEQSHTASYSAKGSTAWDYIWQAFTAQSEVWFRGYVYPVGAWSGNNTEIIYFQNGTTRKFAFIAKSDGSLDCWNAPGTELYSSSQNLNLNAWNLVEIRIKISATVGEVECWINGTRVINATGKDTGTLNMDRIGIGPLSTSNTVYFDNIGVDSSGFLGAVPTASTIYSKVISPAPEGDEVQSVLESDTSTWYTLQSSLANVNASGEYFYDSATDTIYVQTSDDAAPSTHTMNVSVRKYCISMCGSPYSDCGHGYLSFENLHLTGAIEHGLFFNNASYYDIDGLTVEYCGETGIYHRDNADGTEDDLSVTNCTVRHIGTDFTVEDIAICGILAEGVNDAVIADNTVSNIAGPGIRITAQSGQADVTGADVQDNDVSGCIDGIYIFRATAPKVYRNHVHDGNDIGIFIGQDSDNAEVYYNLIHDLTWISGHGAFNGIDINNAENGEAYNNTIYKVAGACLVIDKTAKGDGWTLKNNIFHAEQNGASGGDEYAVYLDSDVTSITADFNFYYFPTGNPTNAVSWIGTTYTPAQWASFVSTESVEDNGVGFSTDPLFVDAATDDFQLQSGSPCIDAGADVSLTEDHAGSTVPSGAAPDMGAYEFALASGGKHWRWSYWRTLRRAGKPSGLPDDILWG